MDLQLRQRGRASLDFVATVGGMLGPARENINRQLQQRGVDIASLADDLDVRLAQVPQALADSAMLAAEGGVHQWVAAWHGPVAVGAFEEVRADLAPRLTELNTRGAVTLEATLGDALPDYHRDVRFHNTGAWEGHDFMGFVHGELVHRRQVARNFGGDIYASRMQVLDELPRATYARILELGTSSGNFTVALTRRYPEADITGVDLSQRMLEQAQRVGNAMGARWRLYQRPAEATQLPTAHFDLVSAYALGHEVPAVTMREILNEAFRVLAPRGDLLLADVVPFAAQDKLQQWWAYHDALRGGEPYWRDFCSLDMAALATEIGFCNARYFGRGARKFPYLLLAHKPGPEDEA